VQWEQFLDLLTVAEVMLFVFGRLLMSGSASAVEPLEGPAIHSKVSSLGRGKKQKNLCDVPRLVVLAH